MGPTAPLALAFHSIDTRPPLWKKELRNFWWNIFFPRRNWMNSRIMQTDRSIFIVWNGCAWLLSEQSNFTIKVRICFASSTGKFDPVSLPFNDDCVYHFFLTFTVFNMHPFLVLIWHSFPVISYPVLLLVGRSFMTFVFFNAKRICLALSMTKNYDQNYKSNSKKKII